MRDYILVVRAALDAMNEEAGEAKATAEATQTELIGKLEPTFFGICLI